MVIKLSLYSLFILLLSSCSSHKPLSQEQYNHSLTVQFNGKPLTSRTAPDNSPMNDFNKQVEDIVSNINNPGSDYSNAKKVMIFIHGGLNTMDDRLDKTENTLEAIRAWNKSNSDKTIYPIFINWHSRLVTWWDRLVRIREGRYKNLEAKGTIPFALLSDAGRTAGRLPEVYYKEASEMGSNMFPKWREIANVPEIDGWPIENISAPSEYPSLYNITEDWRHPTNIASLVFKAIPGVVRAGTIPILDFVLYESYQMMLRRIDMLFRTEKDYICANKKEKGCKNTSAISQLMENLGDKEITLIGHSMGTIAVNEIVRRYPNANITTVVYMAAACTSKDFIDTIPPFLDRKNEPNPNRESSIPTKFYNLTLHPLADKDEVSFFYTLPSGSLLEWLDTYVHRVKTPLDLTFGKWNNAVGVLPLLQSLKPHVKENIYIKGFSKDGDKYPDIHGEFDDFCYWDPEFWDPMSSKVISKYEYSHNKCN